MLTSRKFFAPAYFNDRMANQAVPSKIPETGDTSSDVEATRRLVLAGRISNRPIAETVDHVR